MPTNNLIVKCPWEDCQNQIIISDQAQESDVIVCRTGDQTPVGGQAAPIGRQGCSRNVEIVKVSRDSENKPSAVELTPLTVSEDWGQ